MTDRISNFEFQMELALKYFDIYDRVFNFACRVKRMKDALMSDRRVDRNALDQLVESSSSIGSNMEEARAGQSQADFHAKLRIALKEARESHYWLRYLRETNDVNVQRITPLINEAGQIVAILTTIAKKVNPHDPAHS